MDFFGKNVTCGNIKSHKKQSFTLSLENTVLENPQVWRFKLTPPSPFTYNSLKISLYKFYFIKELYQKHIKEPVKHLWRSENDSFAKINYG